MYLCVWTNPESSLSLESGFNVKGVGMMNGNTFDSINFSD